jgi:hypothetical protein
MVLLQIGQGEFSAEGNVRGGILPLKSGGEEFRLGNVRDST